MSIQIFANRSGYAPVLDVDLHGYPRAKARRFRRTDLVYPEDGSLFDWASRQDQYIGTVGDSTLCIEWPGWQIESAGDASITGFLRSICIDTNRTKFFGAIIHVAMEKRLIGSSIACFIPNHEASEAIANACELGLKPDPSPPWIAHNPLTAQDEWTLRSFSDSAFCAYANAVLADRGFETLLTLFPR